MEQLQQLFDSHKVSYEERGDDFVLCCLSPSHDDKTPSLYVQKDSGIFHCFGCGWKGSIKDLLRHFGESSDSIDTTALQMNVIQEKLRAVLGTFEKKSSAPKQSFYVPNLKLIDFPFRDIPLTLLQYLQTGIALEDWWVGRAIFPVFVNEKLLGFTTRVIDDVSYWKNPNNQSRRKTEHNFGFPSREALYPYDFIKKSAPQRIVLVEGPIDALRLISYNIPALCTFGCKSWSSTKTALLVSLGISQVCVMFDADPSGFQGSNEIMRILSPVLSTVQAFPPAGKDPDNLSKQEAISILSKISPHPQAVSINKVDDRLRKLLGGT